MDRTQPQCRQLTPPPWLLLRNRLSSSRRFRTTALIQERPTAGVADAASNAGASPLETSFGGVPVSRNCNRRRHRPADRPSAGLTAHYVASTLWTLADRAKNRVGIWHGPRPICAEPPPAVRREAARQHGSLGLTMKDSCSRNEMPIGHARLASATVIRCCRSGTSFCVSTARHHPQLRTRRQSALRREHGSQWADTSEPRPRTSLTAICLDTKLGCAYGDPIGDVWNAVEFG